MNINLRFFLLLCVCGLYLQTSSAQGRYQVGILPAINLNTKLKKNWSVNVKTESRQLLSRGEFGSNVDNSYEYVLTDFTGIVAKKVGLNSRLSSGYLLRFRGENTIHRFIQQYTITQNLPRFRLSHRIVTDQTFTPNEATTYRLRYRLATEIPLNGESVDPKELYLKVSNEYLNSLEASAYDLEIRLIPMMGFTLTENQKIEWGFDYRVDSFLARNTRHTFWTSLNWYIVLSK